MNNLGETFINLEQLGNCEFVSNLVKISDEITEELKKQNKNPVNHLAAAYSSASQEAIIKAVAAMIERNNQVLTKQLKDAGLLRD